MYRNFGKILGKYKKEANIKSVGVDPPRSIKFYGFVVELAIIYAQNWVGGG